MLLQLKISRYDITILRYSLHSNFVNKPLFKANITLITFNSWQDMPANCNALELELTYNYKMIKYLETSCMLYFLN